MVLDFASRTGMLFLLPNQQTLKLNMLTPNQRKSAMHWLPLY